MQCMYTVYVLKDISGRLYKGMTNDLARRLTEHKSGKTKTTRSMKELKVVYTEVLQTLEDAIKRERYLKSAAGRRFLKKMIMHP